jgi:hypothetical protein
MRRHELEHIIRAAAAISGAREIVVVGAAALLGAVPEPPGDLVRTTEADVYPLHQPELAEVIDGAIGELSPFHERFRYYAHGVGPATAILPAGWEQRVVKIQNENTDQNIGYCLEPHDLAASKLAAGREKDKAFVDGLLEHKIIDAATLRERIASLALTPDVKERLHAWASSRARADAGATFSQGRDDN